MSFDLEDKIVSVVNEVTQSVVSVIKKDVDPKKSGTGSGVILSEDGYIVTNAHVVKGLDEVDVILPDGMYVKAKVVGTSNVKDIAILKTDATGLIPIELGDPTGVRIGQFCLAVGNALGMGITVTFGMISGVGKAFGHQELQLDGLIQTSAPINPGNCLPGTTRIFMENGVKYIKDVEVGDRVYTLDAGKKWILKSVKRVIEAGVKDIYEVRTNTRSLKASENHPLFKPSGWCNVGDLKRKDLIAICNGLPTNNQTEYSEWMWLLGLFMGDGCYRDRGGSDGYEASFCVYDEVADELKQTLNNLGFDYYVDDEKGVFVKKPKKFVVFLRDELNIATGALNKRIPDWIYSLSIKEKELFLKGLFDADGWIEKGGHNSIELHNQLLLEDARDLAISCGYRVSNICSREREWEIINQVGKTYTGICESFEFTKYNQDKKKSRKYWEKDGLVYDRIRYTKLIGSEMTYDLEIEDTHNFIADGVLVHNSGGALLNLDGQLIGIPTLTIMFTDGVGFDISVADILHTYNRFLETGNATSPLLGIKTQSLTKDFAEEKSLGVHIGALIVDSGEGIGHAAGLLKMDVIVGVDDVIVNNADDLKNHIIRLRSGHELRLKLYREGAEQIVVVTL